MNIVIGSVAASVIPNILQVTVPKIQVLLTTHTTAGRMQTAVTRSVIDRDDISTPVTVCREGVLLITSKTMELLMKMSSTTHGM